MIEKDTVRLLRECDAGVKMGISSIEEVMDNVQSPAFRQALSSTKNQHITLDREIQSLLHRYHDEGKDLSPLVKAMAWMKINMKMKFNHSDAAIAGMIFDGCSMGIRSLNRYLQQYQAASEESKNITQRLIAQEHTLVCQVQPYL